MIALLWLLPGLAGLFAQPSQVYWTDLEDYKVGYQFSSDVDTFAANEQVSVRLYLEAISPATCIGGHFTFSISDLAVPAATAAITVPGQSDLGVQGDLLTGYEWASSTHETYARVYREDETLNTCSDWILTANFVVGTTPLPAVDFIVGFDGGIVLEDNVDMRLSEPDRAPVKVQLYPNPFTEWLEVTHSGKDNLQVSIWNMSGGQVFRSEVRKKSRFNLNDLPRGVLLLQVTDEAGQILHRDNIIHQ